MIFQRGKRPAEGRHPMTPDYGDLSVEHSYGEVLHTTGEGMNDVRTHPNNGRGEKESDLAMMLEPKCRSRRLVIRLALAVANPFRRKWPG